MTDHSRWLLTVREPGLMSVFEDAGRFGYAHLGVPRSGAADRRSLQLANRLLGNEEDTAGIETVGGNLALECRQPCHVAVTGAPCDLHRSGVGVGRNSALYLRPGDVLELGPCRQGLRTYVAVRGGFDAPAVLGSRSYDQLSDIGPPPLRQGDRLYGGAEAHRDIPGVDHIGVPEPGGEPTLRIVPGPDDDDFGTDGLTTFLGGTWKVTDDCNRVGVRLSGPTIPARDADRPSEGTRPGAIQVPSSGQPIVIGPDGGTTGGYPVIGVVIEEDRHLIGQLRPGEPVTFALARDQRLPAALTSR